MGRRRQAICVTTTKPTSSLTPGGGGGCITLVCPQTGSILSSLRASGDNSSKTLLGVSTTSLFPSRFGSHNHSLVLAYGGTVSRKEDTYGMLLTVRNVSSPPILNWKCRLPESHMSGGLIVSPCGHYIVGGAHSGNLCVWSSLGGNLLRTIKAHYTEITVMVWSDCGSYLITAGADGMVHVFSLLDLVHRGDHQTVSPIRNWSVHHLPVTALQVIGGSRVVSASDDGQLVIMEIFSELTIAKIQTSVGIRSLAYFDGRLYAGSAQGKIFTIDLDVYAAHQTSQLGITVKRRKVSGTMEDSVFELDAEDSDCFKSELRGHERTVTALAILVEDDVSYLISGDASGSLRVWDLRSRGCIRVISPWSFSARATVDASDNHNGANKSSVSVQHPVTSIVVVPFGDDSSNTNDSSTDYSQGSFGITVSEKESKANSIVNLIAPLKRFPASMEESNEKAWVPVPFLRPHRSLDSLMYQPLKATNHDFL